MNKVKNVVLGGLIAGTLLASVAPALATDREWDIRIREMEITAS